MFFLGKIKNIVDTRVELSRIPNSRLLVKDKELIHKAKKQGFSDIQIAYITGVDDMTVRKFRQKSGILPCIKKIDTLAGEFPSHINYMYSTYHGNTDDKIPTKKKKKVIVLGS